MTPTSNSKIRSVAKATRYVNRDTREIPFLTVLETGEAAARYEAEEQPPQPHNLPREASGSVDVQTNLTCSVIDYVGKSLIINTS